MLGSRPCRECGVSVPLKIQRDLDRKFYCSRVCRSRFTGRQRDMTSMWAAACTPEANAKKGRKGEAHRDWKPIGSKSLSSHGYVKVKTERGWEYEHRVVAGALPGEDVHHDNEARNDNRPENLIRMSHAEHKRLHRLQQLAKRSD